MQVASQLGPWLGNVMLVIVVSLGLTDYTPVWGALTFLGVHNSLGSQFSCGNNLARQTLGPGPGAH